MPAQDPESVVPLKRKRLTPSQSSAQAITKKKIPSPTARTDEILKLERAIVESPRNYNSIALLFEYLQCLDLETVVAAAVSLCRAFCRIMAKGGFKASKKNGDAESLVVGWLKDRYKDYIRGLCALMNHEDSSAQMTAVTLLMRLLKEEAAHLAPPGEECHFPHMLLEKIVSALVYAENLDEATKDEFVQKYLDPYDDVRYSFLVAITSLSTKTRSESSTLPQFTSTAVAVLLSLTNLPTETSTPFTSFYAIQIPSKKSKIAHPPTHRKAFQECWLSLLGLPGITAHTKEILASMKAIAASFPKPQTLMDFLVDSYDAGGSVSLLALSGLFHLIQTKNLDYPNFYPKLYALLDRDIFFVRHRSSFFRLLDVFLASTHLPATLVASFIKRMARLSLSAPPAAIVTVVPLVYNLLKRHPACTFMLHREGTPQDRAQWLAHGIQDPFNPSEPDPMKTGASESCLWELDTLAGHWHPNVATLASILGQQFTKERYTMEDFLDHSYASMFNAEVTKKVRKPPVVESQVPKRIFFEPEKAPGGEGVGSTADDSLLLALWSF